MTNEEIAALKPGFYRLWLAVMARIANAILDKGDSE